MSAEAKEEVFVILSGSAFVPFLEVPRPSPSDQSGRWVGGADGAEPAVLHRDLPAPGDVCASGGAAGADGGAAQPPPPRRLPQEPDPLRPPPPRRRRRHGPSSIRLTADEYDHMVQSREFVAALDRAATGNTPTSSSGRPPSKSGLASIIHVHLLLTPNKALTKMRAALRSGGRRRSGRRRRPSGARTRMRIRRTRFPSSFWLTCRVPSIILVP